MIALRVLVWVAAINVFALCVYAAIAWQLDGSSKQMNPLALYFLAKGIFCALSLVLSLRILEVLSRLARHSTPPDEE